MSKFRKFTRPLRHKLQRFRLPLFLRPGYYWSLLTATAELLVSNWKNQRVRELLMGAPAVIAAVIALVLIGKGRLQKPVLAPQYLAEGQEALANEEFPRAELLLNRVLEDRSTRLSDARYSMAVLLDETGKKARAAELFSKLAPEDKRGNPDAHRRLAIILGNATTQASTPEDVRRLYWHLNAANDNKSAAMSMAWGRYFLAIRDLKSANEYFEKAVDDYPELWQVLAIIQLETGNNSRAASNYRRASEYLSEELRDKPKNNKTRVDYAQVLMKLGQLDEARIVLEQGGSIDPEGPWDWLLASLAVNYHDLMAAKGESVSVLLGYVRKALDHEPNHGAALNRLMSYATANVEKNGSLKKILSDVISDTKEPALAHLAMGNLCWIEDDTDKAMFHFEQASKLRDEMAVVMNNLAWLVAHNEQEPDYDRAMALVEQALSQQPDDPRFLDTRGTVLLLQKKWKPALVDLEKALKNIGPEHKKELHKKLAEIYTALDLPDIAQAHRSKSE